LKVVRVRYQAHPDIKVGDAIHHPMLTWPSEAEQAQDWWWGRQTGQCQACHDQAAGAVASSGQW
jgi:hypothetical protein